MKIRYIRKFECEVNPHDLVMTLQELVDEWGYDESTPENERTMGIQDLIARLDRDGLLDDEEKQDEDPEFLQEGASDFEHDFYTVDELEAELEA